MHALLVMSAFALIGLAGCQDPPVAPVATTGTTTAPQPGSPPLPPQIEGFGQSSKTFIGGETFDVKFTMKQPGTGTLAQYGLKTSMGEQKFPIKPNLPVLAGGEVRLNKIGPPPNVNAAGKFALEFWVIDSAGLESNHVSTDVVFQ